jgi:hypothetical protein
MLAKASLVVQSLKQLSAQLEAATERTLRDPGLQERMADTVVGCFDLLEQCPTLNMAAWLKRRPRRAALDEPSTAARTAEGRKAILELIALTISDLEASAVFRPEVECGVLPMRAPRLATAAQREALQQGREKLVEQRLKQEQLRNRRFLRTYDARPMKATDHTPPLVAV